MAGLLHRYYYKHRIICEDKDVTSARLALIYALRTVLAEALRILGVSAPEVM
ncbi:MAG: DALR anticodon-binding domain-containing protein [bacterium]